jgi:hypothetical protein
MRLDRMVVRILVFLVRGYQSLSRFTPPQCRFYPTCSQYMVLALEKHGFATGLLLGVRRVLRCHPWHPGGHDPVPEPLSGDVRESD